MHHSNVYVEALTEKISARALPVSSLKEVRAAMEHVQKLDDEYHKDGELIVPEQWHAAAILDFSDWLFAHVPFMTEPVFSYNFGDISFVADYQRYNAQERRELLEDAITEMFGEPTPEELAQAHIVADMLMAQGNPMTVNAMCEVPDIADIYVPAATCPPDFAVDNGNINENEDAYSVYLSELALVALACIKSHTAALGYTVHLDDNTSAIGAIVFVDGHLANIPQEKIAPLLDIKMSNTDAMIENMSGFVPHSNLEALSVQASAGILFALQADINAATEAFTKEPIDLLEEDNIDLTLSNIVAPDIVIASNAVGEFAAIGAPAYNSDTDLIEYFEELLETSALVESTEATRALIANVAVDAASNILLFGEMDETSRKVYDFVQVLDFGLADPDIDPACAQVLSEHADVMEELRELDLNDEIYEEMPDEQKKTISTILENLRRASAEMRTVVSLEGQLDTEHEGQEVRGITVRIPNAGAIPEHDAEEFERIVKRICMDAYRSPDTTMFITGRVPSTNQVALSGIRWQNGKWQNLDEEQAMFYALGTSVGSQLDITPIDDIEYRKLD